MRIITTLSLILVASTAVQAQGAARESGQLHFEPATPRAGEAVRVTYRASDARLRGPALIVRGVFRAPEDWRRNNLTLTVLDVAQLRRGPDGSYGGEFTFPATATFGRFAVGTPDTLAVDANAGRHWVLLAHGEDHAPVPGALSAAAWDDVERNEWGGALQFLSQLTERFPDDPGSWLHRIAIERGALGEGGFAAKRPGFAAQLGRLDAIARSEATVSPERMGTLFFLAVAVGDSARGVYWRSRLVKEAPLDPLAVQERMEDLYAATQRRYAERLDSLEAIWRVAGPIHRALLNAGMGTARAARDSAAYLRWVQRAVASRMIEGVDGATQLGRMAALVPVANRQLLGALDSLDRGLGHRLRDVDWTLEDVERTRPARRREILEGLAKAAVVAGDSATALVRYVEAGNQGWSPDLFQMALVLARARGDTLVARRMSALLAADPMTPASQLDSIRAADPGLRDDAAWRRFVALGDAELRRRASPGAPRVDASKAIRLASWDSTASSRPALAKGRPTVIALWSAGCPYSAPQLPRLARMDSVLASRGVRLLVVTRDTPSPAIARFVASQRAAPPIHYDPENTVGRTFAAYGYPWFFVLDREGRLRTKGHDISVVAAEALAVAGMR